MIYYAKVQLNKMILVVLSENENLTENNVKHFFECSLRANEYLKKIKNSENVKYSEILEFEVKKAFQEKQVF